MSSIMRARNGLTGRGEVSGVIGALSRAEGCWTVSVLPEPVTLSSVTVLDPAGKELMRIEGAALAAVTQPLFAHTKTS
jgi:hypothetical protein